MMFFKKHKKLSVFLGVVIILVAGFIAFVPISNKRSNVMAEDKLKLGAPIMAREVGSYFDGNGVTQTEKSFYCYDSSVKFSSPDLYCAINYKAQVAPKPKLEENYSSIRNFYDYLTEAGWDVGGLISVSSWNDTLTRPASGEMLQTDKNGAIYISGDKSLGNGVLCRLSSSYLPPQPHQETKDGVFEYSIDCYYKAKKFKLM